MTNKVILFSKDIKSRKTRRNKIIKTSTKKLSKTNTKKAYKKNKVLRAFTRSVGKKSIMHGRKMHGGNTNELANNLMDFIYRYSNGDIDQDDEDDEDGLGGMQIAIELDTLIDAVKNCNINDLTETETFHGSSAAFNILREFIELYDPHAEHNENIKELFLELAETIINKLLGVYDGNYTEEDEENGIINDADVLLENTDIGQNLLMLASKAGLFDLVKLLIIIFHAQLQEKDGYDNTFLSLLLQHTGAREIFNNYELFKLIIISLNAQNDQSRELLQLKDIICSDELCREKFIDIVDCYNVTVRAEARVTNQNNQLNLHVIGNESQLNTPSQPLAVARRTRLSGVPTSGQVNDSAFNAFDPTVPGTRIEKPPHLPGPSTWPPNRGGRRTTAFRKTAFRKSGTKKLR